MACMCIVEESAVLCVKGLLGGQLLPRLVDETLAMRRSDRRQRRIHTMPTTGIAQSSMGGPELGIRPLKAAVIVSEDSPAVRDASANRAAG